MSTTTTQIPAGHWRIDPQASTVAFITRPLGLLKVRGHFEGIDGHLDVAEDGGAQGRLRVATATIQTGNRTRDRHLTEERFFGAETHPYATFSLESVTPAAEGVVLAGRLQIRDAELSVHGLATVVDPDGSPVLQAEVTVDHGGGGLGWAKPPMIPGSAVVQVALALTPSVAAVSQPYRVTDLLEEVRDTLDPVDGGHLRSA